MRTKLMRLVMMVFYPAFWERQALWVIPALRRGLALIRERRPDVIYTSTGPFCSNLIGFFLSRWTGVPWVTDYRDLWTGSWLKWWPTRIHFELERALERACLNRATRVIANTPAARDTLVREFPSLDADKVDVIPNGWDEPPETERDVPAPGAGDGPIVLLHTGSFDAPPARPVVGGRRSIKAGLRDWIEHRRTEYDLSTHGPAALFEALADLRARAPEQVERLSFHLVGRVATCWVDLARRLGIEDRVEFLGPRSFAETRLRQARADVLVLTTVSRRDRGPVPRVNAKIYEYMRAGRPILVLSDPGDATRFAEEAGLGWIVSPRDRDEIREALGRMAEDPARRLGEFAVRRSVVESFGAEALSRRFAETFERVAEGDVGVRTNA